MTRHLLLCDDEVHILRAAEFKLTRAGYFVQCASDGLEAWDLLQANPPLLVVTDCQMPRLDGLGLVQRMRQDALLREVPVIMLTAKGLELPHEELADNWGVSAVFSKPFSPRELLRCIDELLQPQVVA